MLDMASREQRVNLRTPDILGAVREVVGGHYRSPLIESIRARGHVLSHGGLTLLLARDFGFCYGVERAIDLAYAALRRFAGDRIFILGEIIHNPDVNRRLEEMGIRFLSGPRASASLDDVVRTDVVIVPAFGAPKPVIDRLRASGCTVVDTTCGDVLGVWRRVRQYADAGFTTLIHGRARHEETLATSSWAEEGGDSRGHYLVVRNLAETDAVCDYIRRSGKASQFLARFEGATSAGFDPDRHLERIGLANQTTMLSRESLEVAKRIRGALLERHGEAELADRFRHFDTICGATQDRQDATVELLRQRPDLMIVVGGYNSSNTSHLVEIVRDQCPAFFVQSAACLVSAAEIRHYSIESGREIVSIGWLPRDQPLAVGITAGASSPSRILEDVIRRIFDLYGAPLPDEGAG